MVNLGGRVIACLETRYAAELADLVTRHGGITYQAPCLREVHEPDAADTRLAVELIGGERVQAVIFLTGVGVHTIAEGARRLDQEQRLLDGWRPSASPSADPRRTTPYAVLGHAWILWRESRSPVRRC